jgi:hypothetical protein
LVRLRITHQPAGSVDGIRLDDFIVDFVYEVGTTLGSYLLAQGLAEPVPDHIPGLVPPLTETRFSIVQPSNREPPSRETTDACEPISEAADRGKPPPKR